MMKFKIRDTAVYVSYPAVAFFALAILSAPDIKVYLCLLSAVCHELGHLLAMKKYGFSVRAVSINLGDISIRSENSPCIFKAELTITLAGVLINFMLSVLSVILWYISKLFFFRDFAVANLCIGCFNALPLSSLDGGNLLVIALERRYSLKTAEKILTIVTAVFLLPLLIIGFLVLFSAKNNFSLLFAALYLIYIFVSKEIR